MNHHMSKQKTITTFQDDRRTVSSQEFLQPILLENERLSTEAAEYPVLDVGCGTKPKGTVNVDFFRSGQNTQIGDQIQGETMDPRSIPNFVVADACHLPFKDNAFNMVISSHTIEHVLHPAQMFAESCRVAKRKTVIRCPHKRGSGAKMPFHRHYLDETWFGQTAEALKLAHTEYVTAYDYPISNKLPKNLVSKAFKQSILWRILRHVERRLVIQKMRIPFEVECQVNKKKHKTTQQAPVKFVVVYNNADTLNQCFLSSSNVNAHDVILRENSQSNPLPAVFNRIIAEHLHENIWLVFCHQDFVLQEDLTERLKTLDTSAIYGAIGTRLGENQFYGQIVQTNGKPKGLVLKKETPVQTLDEMCLIVHTSMFRQGIRFDESLGFHFYGADLCMQTFFRGFDVYALQLACQHRSRTITGDVTSTSYLASLELFKDKWKVYLPIRITTKTVS